MVETGNLSLPEGVKATGQAIGTQVIIQMMPGWVVMSVTGSIFRSDSFYFCNHYHGTWIHIFK